MSHPGSPSRSASITRVADGFSGQRLLIVPQDRLQDGSQLPVVRDLMVTHIGQFQATQHHFIERRRGCAQHVLIYCLSGTGRVEYKGSEYSVQAGDVVLLPPRLAHAYFADAEQPWNIFWVHFIGERASDYASAMNLKNGPLASVPNIPLMRQAFEETYRHAMDGYSDAGLLGLTTAFARLLGLVRVHSASGSARSQHADGRILEVIRKLQADPLRAWTIDELAAAAGMSAPHFFDRFRCQTGSSPKLFLIRQRLQIATALMQQSDLSIAQIAQQVGYDDPYYFSRLFKRHFSQSPTEHRRELGFRS